MVRLLALAILSIINSQHESREHRRSIPEVEYVLDLPHCKIPQVPLNNQAIIPEWNVTFKAITCEKEADISSLSDDGELTLTDFSKNLDCCYTEIMRPPNLESDKYVLSKCFPFPKSKSVNIQEIEYFFVTCKKTSNANSPKKSSPLTKFHSQLRVKTRIKPKLKYWDQFGDDKEKPVSVLFVLLDSISRTHALRGIPKTMKYIMEEMNFVDFKGHHTMGEPTIENFVPLMLGTVTSDWEMKKPHYAGKYDNKPFIWRNFSDANYITMDNQDAPLWHTFNFNGRQGFKAQPVDYYGRPYYLALEKLNGKYSKKRMFISHTQRITGTVAFYYAPLVCAENKVIYDFIYDNAWKFLNAISPKIAPSFSVHFVSWPQHDYVASVRLLDDPTLKLMQNIRNSPEIYDNTVIFFMGDHGFRWSNYSDTQEGLLERDLPLLTIRLPERFIKKYPKLVQNFKQNSQRVTSHLDLFKTLTHLHKIGLDEVKEFSGKTDTTSTNTSYGYNRNYGISLFDEIPEGRTCDDAKIPVRFCSCNYPLYSDAFEYETYRKEKPIEGISTVAESGSG